MPGLKRPEAREGWEGCVCGGGDRNGQYLYLFLPREASFSHTLLHLEGICLAARAHSHENSKTAKGWCLLMEVILLLPLMQGLHVLENPDPRKPQVPPSWCGPPSFLTWTLLP